LFIYLLIFFRPVPNVIRISRGLLRHDKSGRVASLLGPPFTVLTGDNLHAHIPPVISP